MPGGMGPLETQAVKRLIRQVIDGGRLGFSRHAFDEMAKDKLTTVDCVNVLRGGVVEPGEFENGSWRYRIKTNRICVVVAFHSEQRAVVVTAWRIGQR